MSRFVGSDFHFWHRNILKFCPGTRPYASVEEMNEDLIRRWNEQVGEDDEVFYLGDFCFGGPKKAESIVERLNGNLTFILGNHDGKIRGVLERYGAVHDYLKIRHNGSEVVLFHYPIARWDRQSHGSVHLYGHVHGDYHNGGRSMDVGLDNALNYPWLDPFVDMDTVVNHLLRIDVTEDDNHHRSQ